MSTSASETTANFRSFGIPWPDLNDGLFYNDVVSPSDSELTLIELYSRKHKNSAPLQGWLQRILNGQIRVDGLVVKEPATALRVGSKLVYHRLPWREPDAPYLLQVLYEDDHMIALNKPVGLQVLPGGLFQQRTVLMQLQWWTSYQNSSLSSQKSHPVPVHRLGRGTSGILLCAKTKLSKTTLAAYFADKTSLIGANCSSSIKKKKITKIYRAIVNGIINQDKVIITQPIGTMRYPGVAKGLYVASSTGKPALSKVEVLERDTKRNLTLLQVEIESGRPHQIRIHLSFVGHPLLGDPLYVAGGLPNCLDSKLDESFAQDGGYQRPSKPIPGDCGYHLHAHQLILSHPVTNELLLPEINSWPFNAGIDSSNSELQSSLVLKITAPLPSILETQAEAEAIKVMSACEAT